MKPILVFVAVLMLVLGLGVWFGSTPVAAPLFESGGERGEELVVYTDTATGVSFRYPAAWGEVITTEVESGLFHLSFSSILSGEGGGRPTPFAAYRATGYKPMGRGGYWGDLVTVATTSCDAMLGTACAPVTMDAAVPASRLMATPPYCDGEGTVTAYSYLLPLSADGYLPIMVFNDEGVGHNENCVTTNDEAVSDFAAMVQSVTYVK